MAVTDIQANNKLIKFTQQINREWVRENMFSPYMSDDVNAIIRRRMELKSGGEVMNIPIVTRLAGVGVSTGPLVGNEDKIDDYGMRGRRIGDQIGNAAGGLVIIAGDVGLC